MEDVVGIAFMPFQSSHTRFHHARLLFALVTALAVHVFAPASHAQETIAQLDPAQTRIEFTLGATFHTVHGTFKLKSGTIRFDPATGSASGVILVDAASGESGNSGRDRRMQREILESGRFPEIIFSPRQITGALALKVPSKVIVAGRLRLHGLDHDVTIPVDIQPDGQQLQIATRLIIPFIQWGLKNPNTFLLRVSGQVTIDIHAVGRVTTAGTS
jgi:polyisoprenoid-binding protein YceI